MTTESTYKVPLTTIQKILPHEGADRLEIAVVYGFQVIVKKDLYKVNDRVIYVPVDSIINPQLEYHLFPEGSKIKLSKGRIKQIRIRKLASQGLLISPEDVKTVFNFTPTELEKCYANELKIVKYEPPTPEFQKQGQGSKKRKPLVNNYFHEYNGLQNIKWMPYMFEEGELVVYQEKIHGSNARASIVPYSANTLLRRIKKFLGLTPKYEKCYGSNKVQLQDRKDHTGFYGENVYKKVFDSINVFDKLKPNEIIYGELYGEGIQKNYHYGVRGEHKFVLFDVKVYNPEDDTYTWLNPDQVKEFAIDRGFDMVPELYRGPYSNMDHVKSFTLGDSVFAPCQKVREGLVVKSLDNYTDERGNKRALKAISEKYLDKDQTDFH